MAIHDKLFPSKIFLHRTKLLHAKILLVDDYPANILVAGTCLEGLGLRYDVAINGLEAVQLVTQTDYTVILMDINMPEMDGITATTIIRKFEKDVLRSREPIIALTAHPDFLEDDMAQLMDMDGIIMKPFQLLQLKRVLQKYINLQTT